MKNKLKTKKIFFFQVLLSFIGLFLPFFPILYSLTNNHIEVISGYSLFPFLKDSSATYLYYGSVCFTFYLAFMGILFLFGILSIFLPKEREKGDKRIALFFLFLNLVATIAMAVLFSLIGDMNLHLNFGAYLLPIYCFLFFLLELFGVIFKV